MSINASKMALKVLAALRSCFFSLVFLTLPCFFVVPDPPPAAEVEETADDAVLCCFLPAGPPACEVISAFLISCFGTNLASNGKALMASVLQDLRSEAIPELLVLVGTFLLCPVPLALSRLHSP